ncbi:MAG: hypothetical protein ACYS8Z_18685, partial [Planctomycetota bacterium]
PAFNKSTLGRICNDAEVQAFVQTVTEQLIAKVKAEIPDANETEVPSMLLNFAKLVVKRPVILGLAGKETENGPPIYGFAILDAGGQKGEIAAAIEQLQTLDQNNNIEEKNVGGLKMHGPAHDGGVPGYWGWVDNYFIFAMNDGEGLGVKRLQQPRTATPDSLTMIPTNDDIFAAYVDCRKVGSLVETIAEQESATDMLALVSTAIDTLGLKDVRTLSSSARFEGANLVFSESMEVPQPRKGLFESLKPVDVKMFDLVDGRALRAGVFNCDMSVIYDTIMSAIKAVAPPQVSADIDKAIAQVQSQIQVDIRKDILGSLASPGVYYSLPGGTITEAPGGGFVAIAELKDAAALEKGLESLAKLATSMGGSSVQITSQPQDDGKVLHTCVIAPLAIVQVMPCWMITDDHILVASNPTLHKLALARLNSPKTAPGSIRTVAGFKAATANLPENLTYLCYTDSKVQFKQMMLALQGMWPMANMFAAGAGFKLPPMLPSLTEIIDDMGPSVQYSWYDDKGLHAVYRGSGAEISMGTVAGGAMGAGIALPALARARSQARQAVSRNNLKQIGLVLHMYAMDNDGRFPESIDQAKDYYKDARILDSPRKPTDFDGPSYIYIPGHSSKTEDSGQYIITYENPEFCDGKINALFIDGHVEALEPDKFLERLKSTYELLGKEMPEIKFKEAKSGGSPFPFLQ